MRRNLGYWQVKNTPGTTPACGPNQPSQGDFFLAPQRGVRNERHSLQPRPKDACGRSFFSGSEMTTMAPWGGWGFLMVTGNHDPFLNVYMFVYVEKFRFLFIYIYIYIYTCKNGKHMLYVCVNLYNYLIYIHICLYLYLFIQFIYLFIYLFIYFYFTPQETAGVFDSIVSCHLRLGYGFVKYSLYLHIIKSYTYIWNHFENIVVLIGFWVAFRETEVPNMYL